MTYAEKRLQNWTAVAHDSVHRFEYCGYDFDRASEFIAKNRVCRRKHKEELRSSVDD